MTDTRRETPWTAGATPAEPARWQAIHKTPLERFLGGSPLSVAVRLVFVSLIVGAFLMWLDVRPADLFRGLTRLFDRIWAMGLGAIRDFADYILAGAAIVVPIWLVQRVLSWRRAP